MCGLYRRAHQARFKHEGAPCVVYTEGRIKQGLNGGCAMCGLNRRARHA